MGRGNRGPRFWIRVFNDLKARGVQDILVLCGDGVTGLPDAVRSAFPQTDVQLCVVHQIRNAARFVSCLKISSLLRRHAADLHGPTAEAAELVLNASKRLGAPALPCRPSVGAIIGLTAFFDIQWNFAA